MRFRQVRYYELPTPETIEFLVRVVSVTEDVIDTSVEGLEDPAAEILIVYCLLAGHIHADLPRQRPRHHNIEWVCGFRGRLIVAELTHSANFSKFSLPLIKSIYPQLLASKLVDVQPMVQPAALVYYLQATQKRPSNEV